LMPATHQAARDVGSHPAEANHSKAHFQDPHQE
jgi:hypothetical protein